jgi:putative chitinase
MLTETQLRQMLPLLAVPKLQQFLPHLNEAMRVFEINTLLRTAAFVAQTAHESAQYTRMLESLYYTKAAGLMGIWPKRFPTEASALPYLRNEQKLGNFVYANRMGNGDSASGDGFRYRGRGVIQLTGRDGYKRAGDALGLDLVGSPELVQTPEVAFQVAALYWKSNGLNTLADVPDFKTITQRINGGQHGAAERTAFYETAKRVLEATFVANVPLTRGARTTAVRVQPADIGPWSRGWQDSPDADAPVAKKVPAKKVAAKKVVAKRTVAKKAAVKKTAVKKAPAKKVTGKTARKH